MKKFMSGLFALAFVITLMGGGVRPAVAGDHGRGAAFGLGVLGGIIALGAISEAEAEQRAHEHGCRVGPKECRWEPRRCHYDRELGEDVCHGGHEKCWRREYCD
jgi:hypothetical protein